MVFVGDIAVDDVRNPDEQQTKGSSRHPAVLGLVAILLLESAALAAATVYLIVELLVEKPTSFASAVAIAVLVALSAIWVAFIAVGVLRAQSWTRAAIVVVQVLIGAVAIGSFQGPTPRPDLGIILIVPALIAMVLLFQKPVQAATTGRDDTERSF